MSPYMCGEKHHRSANQGFPVPLSGKKLKSHACREKKCKHLYFEHLEKRELKEGA